MNLPTVLGPTMTKAAITHVDILGYELHVGDFVVAYYYNGLEICKIVKLNPKMISIRPVKEGRWKKNVYPHDMVKINPDDVTMFLLRSGKQ